MNKLELENKELASVKQRLAAYFIDQLIIVLVSGLLIGATPAAKQMYLLITSQSPEQIVNMQMALQNGSQVQLDAAIMQLSQAVSAFALSVVGIYLGVMFVYMLVFLAYSGATIGCMLCKIRHVNLSDLGNASLGAAALKAAVWTIMSVFVNGILFCLLLGDALRQSLADKCAGQVVIKDN